LVVAVRRSSPAVKCPNLQKNKYCIAFKAAATNYHLPATNFLLFSFAFDK
jgi:hypothetical protein